MKDELISLETAILACEKGFDEYCVYGYLNLEEGHKDRGKIMNFSDAYSVGLPERKNSEMGLFFTSPTQSLLQKWLREKHRLSLIAMDDSSTQFIEKYWFTIGELHKETIILSDALYDTYEEALEAGLLLALKMIK
jgi:hypothetical protein